jgi:hypothetical protein
MDCEGARLSGWWRLALVGFVLTALILPAPVVRAEAFTLKTPFAFTFANTCTGEAVSGTGTLHQEINVNQNNNLFHAQSASKISVSALGTPSGAKYNGEVKFVDHFTVAAGVNFTNTQTINIIRLGETATTATAGDDFQFHLTLHMTINAKGVPTASVDNFRFECR